MNKEEHILAIVASDRQKISGGGCPVFHCREEESENLCLLLSRVLDGVTHDLQNGVYVIVKH
jgi:hypothetical protein